jgi:hypothetical protein
LDSGFEHEISSKAEPFGWQTKAGSDQVRIARDGQSAFAGAFSLRIDFDGASDPSTRLVYQMVLVEPDSHYRLAFQVRSSELVTGGFPQITIVDPRVGGSGQVLVLEPQRQGSTGWLGQSIEFTTSGTTDAVVIGVLRQGCPQNPCPIFGRLWLDDFSLTKL